jgi:hypothetical protein
MYDKLIPLLGKSIESEEIKALLVDWNVTYPKKVFCTADNPNLKDKIEKHCIRLYFGRGGNSRYMKPVPTSWAGGYIAQFTTIEFTKKRTDTIPFGVKYDMTPDELTAILGKPTVTNVVSTTTTWRKNYTDKHELVVSDALLPDGTVVRSMHLSFIYEADLYSMEDYERVGL